MKVQYPGVEENFKMDFETILFLCKVGGDYGDGITDIMDNLYKTIQVATGDDVWQLVELFSLPSQHGGRTHDVTANTLYSE